MASPHTHTRVQSYTGKFPKLYPILGGDKHDEEKPSQYTLNRKPQSSQFPVPRVYVILLSFKSLTAVTMLSQSIPLFCKVIHLLRHFVYSELG